MAKSKMNLEDEVVEAKETATAVALVEASIAVAKATREANNVIETADETRIREESEAFALRVANDEVSPDEIHHFDARNARIAKVQADILTAKLIRDEQEKTGVTETEGAKLDREAKELADLVAASVVNVIEPFSIDGNTVSEVRIIADKLNEVISYLNEEVEEDELVED